MIKEKKILLVDDSDFDRKVLARALSNKSQCKITEASSGMQCLEILNNEQIDIVLLDIMMPDMDGNELLSKIREKYNPVELPIIMITGKTESTDIINSLKLGANDFISKPVNFEVAVMRITTHLKIAELSREMGKLQQLAALHAVVATYNHEINNPLTIAIANLANISFECKNTVAIQNTESALWRIADIVSKIKEITDGSQINIEAYSGGQDMLKVK